MIIGKSDLIVIIGYLQMEESTVYTGGPNAFGGIITCLGLYCVTYLKGNLKDIIIFISLLGCFFTYSRAALIVFVLLLFVYVIIENII